MPREAPSQDRIARERQARDLLAFYVAAGVDAVLGEAPVDHLADDIAPATGQALESEPPRPAAEAAGPPAGAAPPARRAAPPPPEAAVMAAREAAAAAQSLDALRALLEDFQGCALRASARRLVFADGNPDGPIMFVGEAPGYEEDLTGRAFVGRSGKLLDLMLAAIGLDRTRIYVANVIPWRPPGNRTPTPQETAICLPFIRRQIELADPDILVCLGQPATQTLLGTKTGILRSRGRWVDYHTGRREIRAIATLHPAYLLRQPLQKRLAWRDFLAIRKALGQ